MTDKLEGYIKFSEIDEKKLELKWIERISKLLVGKKIVKIQYMTNREITNNSSNITTERKKWL